MSFYDFSADKEVSNEPIPAGVYNLVITSAEDTMTKKMDKRVKMTFTVMDGDYAGRKIWEGYNLTGANEKAVQISRGQIKALLKAGGKEDMALKDAGDFMGIEVTAVVKVKADETYGDKNVISAFKPKKAIAASEGNPFA